MDSFENESSRAQLNASDSNSISLGSVLHATAIILIMAVIIVGNVLVLLVIYRQRARPSSRVANMLIANLAVVDLSIAMLLFPFSVVTILLQRWAFGDAFCQFNGATNMIAGTASILTMAVISIDRCGCEVFFFLHRTLEQARLFIWKSFSQFSVKSTLP